MARSAVKKKPPFVNARANQFFNASALITSEIMRSRDAEYNTGKI